MFSKYGYKLIIVCLFVLTLFSATFNIAYSQSWEELRKFLIENTSNQDMIWGVGTSKMSPNSLYMKKAWEDALEMLSKKINSIVEYTGDIEKLSIEEKVFIDYPSKGIVTYLIWISIEEIWNLISPERGLPPNLFADLHFEDKNGDGILEATESAILKINLINRGKGTAQKVKITIDDNLDDTALKIKDKFIFQIEPNESKEIKVLINTEINLKTAEHKLKINVLEHFGYDMDPAYLILNTKAYDAPKLVFSGLELRDSGGDVGAIIEDGLLQAGEFVKAIIVVQNIGKSIAENVTYSVNSTDENIYLDKNSGKIGDMKIGDVKKFWITLSPNKRVFTTENLPIYLTLKHKMRKGSLKNFQLPIQLNQKPPGTNILAVKPDVEQLKQQIARFEFTSSKFTARISNVLNIKSVQFAKTKRKNSVGVVFGVENYRHLPPAPYAKNDAEIMKEYFKKRLGVEEVVLYRENEVSGFVFDDVFNPDYGELQKAIMKGQTELFVYYSGHGIPNKQGNETYLFPIDGKVERLQRQGYSLTKFFENLNKLGAKHVTVILDACFSGATRYSKQIKLENLIAAKGLRIKIDKPWLMYPNFTVINSSRESETSLAFDKSQTGLFTYYLAAGLQGEADLNADHKITLGELNKYVTKNVIETSRKFLGVQTPQFYGVQNRVLVEW